ncbi:lactate/malate family dehydrogenase [[Mycoplasma] gypis]|uniref:L-lactate dehydrogenase n=1 Tax=[Mycoplasma] gypis TaxID=92404 RepID=A0ABZ2RU73_9BACT|nr:L-lactate dehydrogenase [[Mycoplasma] gypis]MBN0919029.1 L-lactate dehydrogenase [[Mycoplasma] gypis]
MKKIIVVGMGNVGFTFTNIAVSRGLQANYVFVDMNEDICEAHAHDFQDMVALMPRNNSTFKKGTLLEDSKDADVVIITASIPMKKLTDRLQLAADNALLMKKFGDDLKAAGFKGCVVVAANPCDVMAAAIHYASGLPFNKVLSTGTLLDTARMRKFVAAKLGVTADSVLGYTLAEHGASLMAAWSTLKVGDTMMSDLIKANKFSKEELEQILKDTVAEGLYIYSRKGNTQFGIGTSLFEITDAIVNNKRSVLPLGVKLPEEYKNSGIYTSIPVVLGENGYEYLSTKPSLNEEEWQAFEKSTSSLAKVHEDVLRLIGIEKSFK